MDVSELIISLVRQNNCLYDKTNPDFKDVMKKKCVFKLISEKLRTEYNIEISAESVEKRWSSLRDMFSRARRNLRRYPGSTDPAKKWDLYDSMIFLTSHVSHRRTKPKNRTLPQPTSTKQESPGSFIDGPSPIDISTTTQLNIKKSKSMESLIEDISPPKILIPQSQSFTQQRLEHFADDASQTIILPAQSARLSIVQPQSLLNSPFSEDLLKTSSIMDLDNDNEVVGAYCSSNTSSTTTSIFQQNQKTPVVHELDPITRKRRKSSDDIEKKLDIATELLEKVVSDMATTIVEKDPYSIAIGEGMKHVPAEDRTKCLIEILQIIDKYQKI